MDLFDGLNLATSVSDFKSSLSSSMQGVRDNTLTPIDVTTSNIKQGVALKTSKDTGVTGVISDFRSQVVEQLDGIIGSLSGGLLNTKEVTKSIRVGADGVTFSEDSLLGAVSKDVGYSVSSQSGAMRQLASSINKEFSRLAGFNIGSIVTTDGEEFRVNKNWRSQVGSNTLKMVGKYAGIDEYVDVSVKSAIYNSVLYNAVDYGMTGSYRKLYDSYPAGFDSIKRDAVIVAIETAITNGDIESINALLELLEQEGKNTVLAKYPNLIERLFSNFSFDQEVFPEDYPALRDVLLNVLVTLGGTSWYMKPTNFGDALNLTLINKASKDMITLLSTVDEIVPLLCTAGMFSERSAVATMKGMFKDAPQFEY